MKMLVNDQLIEMTPEEVEEHIASLPVTAPVLPPLTARQLRLCLVSNGLALDQVESAIAAIEEPQQRAVATIEWEYASQFERDHPLIAQVGAALGLDEAAIDEMWRAAAFL